MGVYTDTIQATAKRQRYNQQQILKEIDKLSKDIEKKQLEKQKTSDMKAELKNRLKDFFYNYFEEHKSNFYDDEPQNSFLYLQKLKTQTYVINELIIPKENDIYLKKEYLANIYQRELKKIYNYYNILKHEEFEELDEEDKEEIKIYNLKKSTIQLQKNLEEFNKDCKMLGMSNTPTSQQKDEQSDNILLVLGLIFLFLIFAFYFSIDLFLGIILFLIFATPTIIGIILFLKVLFF